MPELPEVETTCRGIAPHVIGATVFKVVIREARLRWPISEELATELPGRRVQRLWRRGKYLLFELDNTQSFLMHLGMSGCLRMLAQASPPERHDHLDIIFDSGMALRLTDPRRFGAVLWTGERPLEHPLLRRLGPEPLSDAFDADYLVARLRGKKAGIKQVIMDSQVVVGVGNIYANEALFAAGIAPQRPAGSLRKKSCALLVDSIKAVLQAAVTHGGTTLRDFLNGEGKPGYFRQELKVYGRGGTPCLTCTQPLTELRLGQRSTVYCRKCQR